MIGQIRLFAFSRPPRDWLPCDGSLHPIEQYPGLFTLIGIAYGGDGAETFAVPDLRGRLPIHQGTQRTADATRRILAQTGGSEQVALEARQVPVHHHPYLVSSALATSDDPTGHLLAAPSRNDGLYIAPDAVDLDAVRTMSTRSIPALSTSNIVALHDNLMPTLTASYCIAARGAVASRADF
jgi:microcystin-dependent protein